MPAKFDHSRPLPVAFCITDLEPGGAERCLAELAARLDRRQFAPAVYCIAPSPEAPRDALVVQLRDAGVPTEFLGLRRRRRLFAATGRLARALRRRPPAILQTFLFHANVVGALAARIAPVGRVVGGIRVAERRSRLRLWAERRLTGKVARFVCVSQSVADFSAETGRLPREKLVVIPNGVDVERFRAAAPTDLRKFGLPAARRAMCVVGRLERQKNLDWLLRELPPLMAVLKTHDLVVVGDGPEREPLQQLAAEQGLAGRVHFAPWQPDIAGILAASDLLLLPSAWEGMPNVVLEAMAAGRPVVAADVEGVRQCLGTLASHQVVPPEDGRLLRDRIAAILGNADLAARLGHGNQLRAEHEFSLPAMVAAYEQVYLSLVRG